MNDQSPINDTPETLKGCLWALGTGTTLLTFLMLSWLGIQRAEVIDERHYRRTAEADLAAAQTDFQSQVQILNRQIVQQQSALADAQSQTQASLQSKIQAENAYSQAKAECDRDEQAITYLRSLLARARN
jgi:uncharacterized protein YlxW (UPF0749 family)